MIADTVSSLFQSTLPRRERLFCNFIYLKMLLFQSTLPRRERRPVAQIGGSFPGISIHAPAKGATALLPATAGITVISIHAPAKGATSESPVTVSPGLFQSTLPRRERRNSRCSYHRVFPISIHAPAKGATITIKSRHNIGLYFNPRSREGSDRNDS